MSKIREYPETIEILPTDDICLGTVQDGKVLLKRDGLHLQYTLPENAKNFLFFVLKGWIEPKGGWEKYVGE